MFICESAENKTATKITGDEDNEEGDRIFCEETITRKDQKNHGRQNKSPVANVSGNLDQTIFKHAPQKTKIRVKRQVHAKKNEKQTENE